MSGKKMFAEITKTTSALQNLGMLTGDKIAILGLNCTRYFMLDVAIGLSGGVSVPIYYTSQEQEILEIIKNSDSKFLFIGDPNILKNFKCNNLEVKIISFCSEQDTVGNSKFISWSEFMSNSDGKYNRAEIAFDKLATIRYTSGTTGNPKGIMFNHFNLKHMAQSLSSILPWEFRTSANRYISFLPLNHVVEGILTNYSSYFSLYKLDVYYLENFHDLQQALIKVRPTIFFLYQGFTKSYGTILLIILLFQSV